MISIVIGKWYAKLFGFIKDRFGYNIRGFGFVLRKINTDAIIQLHGAQLFFDHREAEAYSRVLAGHFNEPETHLFINKLALLMRFNFIEVGGSIGEILVDIGSRANVISSFVFEPNPRCFRIIKTNVALNGLNNVQVEEAACGDIDGSIKMFFGSNSPTASVLSQESLLFGQDVRLIRLDTYFKEINLTENVVMLIDVEGFEPNVLKGSVALIERYKPIIIFEYNSDSRKHYHISQISEILGSKYKIMRLNRGGFLDDDVEHSYNCVALPLDFQLEHLLDHLL
jgi:FkbM family methyltransferase